MENTTAVDVVTEPTNTVVTEEPTIIIPRLEMLRLAYEIEESSSQRIVHYIDVSAQTVARGGKVDKVDAYMEELKTKAKDVNGDYWIACAENDRRSEIAVVPGKVMVENVMSTAEAIRKFIEG